MIETFTYQTGTYNKLRLETYSQTDNILGSPSYGETRTWTYNYSTLPAEFEVLTSVDGPGLVADGVTDVTSYEYDDRGSLTKVTDANGLVTEFLTLNKMGQPTLMQGPDGVEWGFAYDHRGRMISSTYNPNGSGSKTATYTYDVIGQMLSSTDMRGNTTTFEYDEARRLVKTINAEGEVADYEYDLMGNLTRTAYSNGDGVEDFWEETEYDELGRLLKTLGAQGQIWQFAHDEEDNLDSIIDPVSYQVEHSFDALNRLIDTVDQAGYTTNMDHNDADQVTTYTDPRSIDTGFAYNGFGEVLTETSQDKGTTNYSYNTRGLVTSMTDGNGVISDYEYDNGGRLTARRFPSSPDEDQTFFYDLGGGTKGVGKIGEQRDESGHIKFSYTTKGPLSKETHKIEGGSYKVSYSFDVEGNLNWVQYPSRRRIQYALDDALRIRKVQHRIMIRDPQTGITPPRVNIIRSASYLPNGPRRLMTYEDGFVRTTEYDTSYRATRLRDKKSGNTLYEKTLFYTDRDNISQIKNVLAGNTVEQTFDYTARGFMENADGPWGELDYSYDSVGNRLARLITTSGSTTTDTYSYPATSNRLQSVSGGQTRSFTYDAAGNVTYDARSGVGYGYTYNAANRMESFSINGVVQAEYRYNARGQQVIRRLTQTGQTIHSIYDTFGNRIAEYEYDDVSGSSTLLREYVWMDGQAVAVIEGGEVYYVRSDHIGRPVFATDDTGTIVWEAEYLPFGGVHVSTGSNINLRFPGQWFQSESGLHQNWMRDYDPTTGRYIQADPLGLVDGASVYGYALQNPGRYVDPRGEQAVPVGPQPLPGGLNLMKRLFASPDPGVCTTGEGPFCTLTNERPVPGENLSACYYSCPDGSTRVIEVPAQVPGVVGNCPIVIAF